jgi:hypothetical protein
LYRQEKESLAPILLGVWFGGRFDKAKAPVRLLSQPARKFTLRQRFLAVDHVGAEQAVSSWFTRKKTQENTV